MRRLERTFGERNLAELDEAAIRAFLRALPHKAQSKLNMLTKIGQFLSFCRREGKWIASNPVQNITIKVKRHDVTILSVPEVERLISAALTCDYPQSVIPFIAVQLFTGLRPYEAARLRWEQIHFETGQLEVLAATSKTRESRFVPMEGQLIETLLPARKPKGSIKGPKFVVTLKAMKQAAGFTFVIDRSRPWPPDVLRHCYGTYWLAIHQDRAHLAELMGNSVAVIKAHYRRAIPIKVAREYWQLSFTVHGAADIIPISARA